MDTFPNFGVGLSYRRSFGGNIDSHRDTVQVLEIVVDNIPASLDEQRVLELADRFPLICHCLELSVGSDEPLDGAYVDRVARLAELLKSPWVGDHLAMTRVADHRLGHLLPLCFSRRSVEIVAAKVKDFQARTGLPLLLENIAYYFEIPGGEMTECEFISAVCDEADCGLLLDVANLHVNALNHQYSAVDFIENIPLDRVAQMHLAGSSRRGSLLVDSHSAAVTDEVWDLFRWVIGRCQPNAIVLEWDRDFPPMEDIIAEVEKAHHMIDRGRKTQ